jgi:ribosomal protein S6--L-glutamate ligase
VFGCGEAFGITIYGVDVIRSEGQHWLVDMSSFPGFKGVPQAGRRIADHLAARLT